MFTKRVVLAISQKYIFGAKIRLVGKKILKSFQSEWQFYNLEEILLKAKRTLKARKVRILLADDVSYTLSFQVPKILSGRKERELLFKKLREEIPENLEDSEWDFKEVRVVRRNGTDYKEVFAFAPVRALLQSLNEAIKKVGMEVEAVEPQEYAAKRHPNPLIGLALKRDIKGRDAEVLNLNLITKAGEEVKDMNKKISTEKKLLSLKTKKVGVTIFAVLLFMVLIFLFINFRNKKFLRLNPGSSEKDYNVSPTSFDTRITPVSESEIYGYSINVLDGLGSKEAAEEVKRLLEENGFKDVELDEAQSFEYEVTVVKTKEGISAETLGEIRNSLRGYELVFPSSFLDPNYEFDIEIIVGK